jgi:hypothetical protein
MATNQHETTEDLVEMVFPVVRAATVATQQCGKHAPTTIEELCFLRSPWRGIILNIIGANQSVDERTSTSIRDPSSRQRGCYVRKDYYRRKLS